MKIVTCASYHGTGSSAFTDLISEYSKVNSMSDYEFRFVHDTDGLSDLEFHLVECPNRHNSGHALKRFEKLAKFNHGKFFNERYEPFFNNEFFSTTEQYVNSLLEFKIKGYRFYDLYDRGTLFYYLFGVINKIIKKSHIPINLLPNNYQYYSILDEDTFLEKTQQYTSELLSKANTDSDNILLVDQLLPSSNIHRCLRYFKDEVFVVVVDRDPRDVYILNKYLWKEPALPINPDDFCKWYDYTHRCSLNEDWNDKVIKRIYFEDLIYKYTQIVKQIEDFIGLKAELHTKQYQYFNPKRSYVNTRLWEKYSDKGIEQISDRLSQYLYNYKDVEISYASIPGKDVIDNRIF